MKEPKYRFLFGYAPNNFSNLYGYVDKETGEVNYQQESEASTKIYTISHIADNSRFNAWQYIATDGAFVSEDSYISIYKEVYNGARRDYVGSVQASNIVGKPYPLPVNVYKIILTITLDRKEAKRTKASPVYILRDTEPIYSKLSKKISREGDHVFFREKLDTDLHFVGAEADYISSFIETYVTTQGVDTDFMLICQKWNYSLARWENYHTDLFRPTDCEFDKNTHTCKPTLSVLDNYTRILDRYSDEYNLIKLKPAIKRIKTYLRPIIELYERGSSVITRFLGGTYWETEVDNPEDDSTVLEGTEHFKRLPINPDLAYAEVQFQNEYAEMWPSGEYRYDSTNHCYRLNDGTNVAEWHPITSGVFANMGLAFVLNGVPVTVEVPGYGTAPVIVMPQNYTGISDLPIDLETGSVAIAYLDLGTGLPVFIPVGGAFFSLYVIYGRVVGNTDTLFGVASYPIPQDDFAIQSHAYKRCAPLSNALYQGYFYGTLDTSLEPTIYGIKENEEEYYTNENLPVEGGIYGVKPMPIGKYEWGDISCWYNYADDYVDAETDSRWEYTIKDCFTIGSVIRALLKEIDTSIRFEDVEAFSQFLFGTPDMKGGYLWKLAITPKSNLLKGDYDQPAKKAPITFEGLMNMLRDLYHLYWYIDKDRRLHIEHAVWFINGGSYTINSGDIQLDLSGNNCKDAYNKKRTAYWQDAYKFNMAEASRRIELDFAEDGTEFFNGLSINLYNNYLQKAKTDSRSISNFTADIDLMRIEPERYSSDGFAILTYVDRRRPPIFDVEPEVDEDIPAVVPIIGAVRVKENNGWQRDAYINNFFASWLYCQHFLMYDISGDDMEQELQMFTLPNGNSLDEVHGLARLKKQEVQFPFEEDPDTVDLIKTTVGDGKPEDFSVDALTRTVKATLSFPVKELP